MEGAASFIFLFFLYSFNRNGRGLVAAGLLGASPIGPGLMHYIKAWIPKSLEGPRTGGPGAAPPDSPPVVCGVILLLPVRVCVLLLFFGH